MSEGHKPLKNIPTGRLDAPIARQDGKAVDEWTFRTVRPSGRKSEDTSDLTIKVKVSLIRNDEGLAFRAKIPGLGTFEHSDIQSLHRNLEDALIQHSAAELGAVWEDWLCITVARSSHLERGSSLSSALSIAVKPVKRGVDPKTGLAYLLSDHGLWAVPMDKEESRLGKSRLGQLILDDDEEVSYVPATPENIAALADVRDRMVTLRERLMQAMSQGKVEQTLSQLGESLLALNAPSQTSGATLSDDSSEPHQSAAKNRPRP